MISCLLLLLLLRVHNVCAQIPLIAGVKATFSNPANASQSFVALLSKPRVTTFNNRLDASNPAWDCQLSQRNCYHWDEMHDWGTFNITVTLEGYITIPLTVPRMYKSALNLFPGSCAQVYLDGNLVHSQCGYPVFSIGGRNASHIDWAGVRAATLDVGGSYYGVPTSRIAKSIMNSLNWVSSTTLLPC
jgi:hypothetical protein